jgi:hypothetical protein
MVHDIQLDVIRHLILAKTPWSQRSADRVLGDADVRIGHMDAMSLDVVKTLVNVKARLCCPANHLDRLEESPWSISVWQFIRAVTLDNSKHAAYAPKYVNLHDDLLRPGRRATADPPPVGPTPLGGFSGNQ